MAPEDTGYGFERQPYELYVYWNVPNALSMFDRWTCQVAVSSDRHDLPLTLIGPDRADTRGMQGSAPANSRLLWLSGKQYGQISTGMAIVGGSLHVIAVEMYCIPKSASFFERQEIFVHDAISTNLWHVCALPSTEDYHKRGRSQPIESPLFVNGNCCLSFMSPIQVIQLFYIPQVLDPSRLILMINVKGLLCSTVQSTTQVA
ncbi:hypothetical protein RRG08_011048 [Elysia crispata]|uniref:Uncharacterized protein n=1 Tax=Elysia crispata TaxID=231223 RepID=A0AAE0Z9S3_9GAST|nr:hypothetical protein RRG08_011048 [Elysia crispata]